MAKLIRPTDLAEIVSTLLVKPELLGSLDTREQHEQFMLAIGRVVSEYCGGAIREAAPDAGYFRYLSDDKQMTPLLSVYPDECLPSLRSNVWAAYDEHGWDEENLGGLEVDVGVGLKDTGLLRHQMRTLLLQTANFNSTLMDDRTNVANSAFENFDFGEYMVGDDDGWQISDIHFSKTVYFETEGDSIKGIFNVIFCPESALIRRQFCAICQPVHA